MSVVASRAPRGRSVAPSRRVALRRFLAWHPEWWVHLVAVGAWVGLAASTVRMTHARSPSPSGIGAWFGGWTHWLAMVVAMMLPVVALHVRAVAMRSIWSRRHRSAGLFVLGYLALWATLGAAVVGAVVLAGLDHGAADLVVVSLLLAAAWQSSVPRRRLVRRCTSLKLGTPTGWAGDLDCLRVGARAGVRCCAESWPAMLAMALSHSLLLMAGLSVVLLTERARGANPAQRAGRALEGWVLAGFAAVALVAALT